MKKQGTKKVANNAATAIRLGNLKPVLQQEAFQNDRSLNYLVIKILRDYVKSTDGLTSHTYLVGENCFLALGNTWCLLLTK